MIMSKLGVQTPGSGQKASEGILSENHILQPRLVGLILAGITLLVYWPVVGHGFVNYDDGDYFASNWHVLEGVTPDGLRWAFGTGFAANWHPLTWISLMLDADIFGSGATGPHFVNLILHLANTVLLFTLLRRMTGALWPSAIVGGLFALHPLHVESVAWISERKDVLSTFFGLLALCAYEAYAHHPRSPQARKGAMEKQSPLDHNADTAGASRAIFASFARAFSRSRRRWFYLLALLLFALALMSKPMLVTLPFVMLLLDYWPLRRMPAPSAGEFGVRLRRLVWEKIPFLALSAACCAVTLAVQASGGAVRSLAALPVTARLENALVSYIRYIGKVLWPENLAVLYPHPGHWPPGQVVLAATLLAAGCLLALWMARGFPFFVTGWLCFLGTLVPVIGLVQVGVQSMADRYMYLPIVGLLIPVVWGAKEVLAHYPLPKAVPVIATALILFACAARTRDQLAYWRGGEELFSHAISVTEHNDLASGYLENNLGNNLYRRGQVDEAIEHYRRAVRLFPEYPLAHNNLGIALMAAGDSEAAMEEYAEALRREPGYANAHLNLADAMAAKGRNEQAIRHYRKALEIEPHSAAALNNLAAILMRQGSLAEAIECYRKAVRFRPDFVGGRDNLAAALVKDGKVGDAMTVLTQALKENPGDSRAHYLLGTALALQGRTNDALSQFYEVARLKPDFPGVREQITALRGPELKARAGE